MATIIDLCRELRQRQTPVEKILWYHLRNRKLSGRKFLRQHPLCFKSTFHKDYYYIADFYCHEANLVIEADGSVHDLTKEYDKNRDIVLNGLGLNTLRFDNDQILNNITSVLNTIERYL